MYIPYCIYVYIRYIQQTSVWLYAKTLVSKVLALQNAVQSMNAGIP